MKRLFEHLDAEVHFDLTSRTIYSTDASIYEILPTGVLIPRTIKALREAVMIAAEHQLPIIPRGAATGLAGGAVGKGLVIDLSKYLRNILEVGKDWISCEPGVVLDTVNATVPGMRFGAETSTHNRATIGGMIATNAAGGYSMRFGPTSNHLLEVDLLTPDGEIHTLGPSESSLIRNCAGYNLSQIVAGSEGTLGIVTRAKLKLIPDPQNVVLQVLPFETLEEAFAALPRLRTHNPLALELIDRKIVELGLRSPIMRGKLDWLEKPAHLLVIATEGEKLPGRVDQPDDVWALRKAGLGLLMSRRTYSRAVSFIEDVVVPVDKLLPFVQEVQTLLQKYDREVGIYGHVGEGCLHIRPFLDLGKEAHLIPAIWEELLPMLKRYGGTTTGEHGDGLVRSWLIPKLFGEETLTRFRQIKQQFDPRNLMNPGKILNGPSPIENLRRSPPEREAPLALASDLCNGNGECLVSCPTFRVHHDERDSTRGRANAIRAHLRGDLPLSGVMEVLEHCVSCKACKTGCPSEVDMAKMKAELTRPTLRNRLFGHVGTFAKLGLLPPEWLLKPFGVVGPLPRRAKKRFSQMDKPPSSGPAVVLLTDTFTEFFEPEIGMAAHKLLSRLGYRVITPPYRCCGRTLFSQGMVEQAYSAGEKLIASLPDAPIVVLEPSCHSMLLDDLPNAPHPLTLEEFLLPHADALGQHEVAMHTHCHQRSLLGTPSLLNAQQLPVGCCGMAGSFGHEKEHAAFAEKLGAPIAAAARALPHSIPLIVNGFSCRSRLRKERPVLHLAQYLVDF
jgi:FAD/FMN-containing dehydrogenase/Fe-S oxidoreductase